MYRDGTSGMGVLAPRAQLGLWSSTERSWRLGFHVVACRHVIITPLAPPLIFIEHAVGGHKIHIFATNIPTFHLRYRR
jgi:hypothetical protein